MKPDSQRLESLILARLSDRSKEGPTLRKLREDIGVYVTHVFTSGQWNEVLQHALSALEAAGHITQRPLGLTESGQERLRHFLGVETLPTWADIQNVHLPALCLGVAPGAGRGRNRLKKVDALRAGILQQHHGLDLGEAPTLGKVIDALVWRQLGVNTNKPLTLREIRTVMLRRLLGADDHRMPLERLKMLAAAQALDLATTDHRALRPALVRTWLWQTQGEPVQSPAALLARASEVTASAANRPAAAVPRIPRDAAGELPGNLADELTSNLAALARRAVAVAERIDDGRFDERKVLVSAVWRQLCHEPLAAGMDLDGFKAQLARAHQQGLLVLHRADLAGAMDADEVAASEVRYLNATFHFIEAERRP